jgi:prolyl 4-hydroxylase
MEVWVVILLVVSVKCEIFTSVEQLADNLLAEKKLVNSLEALIISEEARLEGLKLKLNYFKTKNAEATYPEEYLANSINAFQLIKRLTMELEEVEAMVTQNGYPDFMKTVTELRRTVLPTTVDMLGAGAALIRLQDTYDLKVSEFSKGVINGIQYNASLTVEDCLEIGMQAYNGEDFYHAVLWLQEAVRKVALGDSSLELKERILMYLGRSFYKAGHINAALQVTELSVALNPRNQESQQNMRKLLNEWAKLDQKTEDHLVFTDIHLNRWEFVSDMEVYEHTRMYELLCQGKAGLPTKDRQNLHCRFIDDRSAFLKIAPLKVEQVHRNPDILIFHEVMSDIEIEEIKQLAKQKLERATVLYGDRVDKPADLRVSKSGWLSDSENERVRTLSRRVEDMTGMSVDTAEELQVVNYGIGGQYIPHCDENPGGEDTEQGYRVSTVMFYVSI